MKSAFCTRFTTWTFFLAFLVGPGLAQSPTKSTPPRAAEVPFFAVIETIEFEDVAEDKQKLVLSRIGVRVGDVLTPATRHRIGRELGTVQKGMTFTYKQGSKWGTAKLIISADC